MKGLFFSVPSVSVNKTLCPVIDELAANGYEIIYYGTKKFRCDGKYHFEFREYPEDMGHHYVENTSEQISYFEFGEMLLDSAASLIDFLCEEIEKVGPDFILHSHLAVWGKLLAQHFKLPSITLFTTFVLDKRIMLPFFRETSHGVGPDLNNVNLAMNFHRKQSILYKRLQLESKPDLWDIYVNKGNLNILYILECFQHRKELFQKDFHFLGYPTELEKIKSKGTSVYVSMGTIFNESLDVYQFCVDIMNELKLPGTISLRQSIGHKKLKNVNELISVEEFVSQRETLADAKLFVTRGGMASVHEAIYTCTPMIVVPVIPEQELTAQTINELKIGIRIRPAELTYDSLRQAFLEILDRYEFYAQNLMALQNTIPDVSPRQRSVNIIHQFLIEHYFPLVV